MAGCTYRTILDIKRKNAKNQQIVFVNIKKSRIRAAYVNQEMELNTIQPKNLLNYVAIIALSRFHFFCSSTFFSKFFSFLRFHTGILRDVSA